MSDWGERYDYKGYHGCDCHCYIKVIGNSVLCTEADDNIGTSITNLAETVATLVCRDYHIPLESLTWIEHYTHDGLPNIGETFDLVDFDIVDRPSPAGRMTGKRFVNPRWEPADRDYVRNTFGV